MTKSINFIFALALLACAVSAHSAATVTSPRNNARVVSPFALSATASPCSSQPVVAMGYSLDDSTNTAIVYGTSVIAQVGTTTGAHALHVKSWGNAGTACVTDIYLTVVPPPTASVPPNAIVFGALQTLSNWQAVNDSATGGGTSNGMTGLVNSPSINGLARQFSTTYTNSAGERYFVFFGVASHPSNFLYDGWVYLAAPSAEIANLEMDMNQVIWNGQTVIFGVQCDGYSGTWDYTANAGSRQNPNDQWLHSTATCDPRSWAANTWHHVQITYSRDRTGNVTYESVWLDGVEQILNVTVPSAFALGWTPALITNFQVDGLGAYGSSIVYLDNLTVYLW